MEELNEGIQISGTRVVSAHKELFLAAFASAFVMLALLSIFPARWNTNDDIAMSMIAHGYGIANQGSPNLVFSSVLWGHIVRSIPPFFGSFGYSWASYFALFFAGTAIAYSFLRIGASWLTICAALLVTFTVPVVSPQFTLTAGILGVATAVCLLAFARTRSVTTLLLAVIALIVGFWIRNLELILVLAIAMPLLPWRALIRSPASRTATVAIAASLAATVWVDYEAYRGAAWQRFNEYQLPRSLYTDFGAAEIVKKHFDIMSKHDYTVNDIDLISRFFTADPGIANPSKLWAMFEDAGRIPYWDRLKDWSSGRYFSILLDRTILPILIAAGITGLLTRNPLVFLGWVTFAGVTLALGISGRVGLLRVHLPLALLLALLPLILISERYRNLCSIAILAAGLAVLSETSHLSRITHNYDVKAIAKVGAEPPQESVVVFGAAFPFQTYYPVFGPPLIPDLRIYWSASFSFVPTTISYGEELEGWDFRRRFRSEDGVPMLIAQKDVSLLSVYCTERLQGKLSKVKSYPLAGPAITASTIVWYRCS